MPACSPRCCACRPAGVKKRRRASAHALCSVASALPVTALNGIDVAVAEGEIVCVIGPNGAGKTTLMKTIAGLLRARAGEIEFEAQMLAGRSVNRGADARVRAGIALVPEGRHVFAPL